MFWKRKPKCPITKEDKAWVENYLNWLDQNVVKLENQPTILPTKKYFDWEFKGKTKDADFVLYKVGEYFGVNTDNIKLGFYNEGASKLDSSMAIRKEKGTAGLFVQKGNHFSILIEAQQLKRPDSLIAVMAHELSHYVLAGKRRLFLNEDENEWLTDLLAIAFGFGIFIGNTKFEFNQWQSGDGWGGWQYSIQGYLPQQVTAYAMAVIEIQRTEEMPDWVKLLKGSFRKDFEKSWKYLIAQ